jgi:NMD protein affecting ribosome stability and mRNA decay
MGEIIELKFRSPHVVDDAMALLACSACRNKTYTLTDIPNDFPLMRCAACGQHMGRMGWYRDDHQL